MLPQFTSLLQFMLDEGENITCDIRTSSAAYIVGSLSQQDREQLTLQNTWLLPFSCVSPHLFLKNLNESQSPSSHSQKHHKIQKPLGALQGSKLPLLDCSTAGLDPGAGNRGWCSAMWQPNFPLAEGVTFDFCPVDWNQSFLFSMVMLNKQTLL